MDEIARLTPTFTGVTYEKLDELEPVESDQEAIRPVDELFHWPLAIAFVLTLLAILTAMLPALRRSVVAA